jgi:hypothetical protein
MNDLQTLFLDAPTVLYGRIVGPQRDLANVREKLRMCANRE